MPLMRGASAVVIRCFRRLEKCADAATGAAGPVFVALAWVLTVFCGLAFFDVVARNLSFWPTLLLLPVYLLVPLNLYGQYWLVTHVTSGFPTARSARDQPPTYAPASRLAPERYGWTRDGPPPLPAATALQRVRVRRCRKCNGPKPARTHHCSVCKRCVLLMDHHCPWINACVGLHNQRHFVLFMFWITLGCWTVLLVGFARFWETFDFVTEWDAYTPKIGFTLAYVLSLAIGIAVPILGGWHLVMVAAGETSIETHDNDYLSRKAKSEGLVYLNPYDLGRRRNLQNFFNVGPGGYPFITLLFPLLVPPYSNGWEWPHRPMPTEAALAAPGTKLHTPELADGLFAPSSSNEMGLGDGPGGRYVMGGQDELTDDEDGGGGWWEGPME
ncbi:hypothetical protein Q8F55_008757 [Vanrija albida]|uniref:Palmitoyltransferase n=1 Tax=Vanrija albida TaxID=181172 RepID=A0ABR3PRP9_9TREE